MNAEHPKKSSSESQSPEPNQDALEIRLLGERFRIKPSGQLDLGSESRGVGDQSGGIAREAIEWASRQVAAAEARMTAGHEVQPRAHHVALLALVELAHEALLERTKTAQSLDRLIERLEGLKKQKSRVDLGSNPPTLVPAAVGQVSVAADEDSWLQDDPVHAGAPVTPS